MSGSPALTVQAVSARRGGRLIFADVSLTVATGEAALITGPNGSGKSTLLRLIAGLGQPDSGSIERTPEDNAALRFVGHRDGLKGALTVLENLAFWSSVQDGGETAVTAAMDRLALNGVADMPVDTLSAGWRRRTGLARLIIGHAPLWILDEPYTSLDTDNIARVDSLIADHLKSGGSAIVASHQAPSFTATHSIDMADHPAPAEALDW